MNTCLKYLILLPLGGGLAGPVHSVAQEATSQPLTQIKAAQPVTESEELKAPKRTLRIASQGTNFQERLSEILRNANNQPGNHDVGEKAFDTNYQIKVEYLADGKTESFSIVTANAKLSYNGIMKDADIDGIEVPTTITFEAQLSNETGDSVYLGYFLGRSVPYSSGSHYGAKGGSSYTTIQQLQVGIKNGATFQFGKPLKVVESDGETITITISKVKNQ